MNDPSLGFSFSHDHFTKFLGQTRDSLVSAAVAACPHVLIDAPTQGPHRLLLLIQHRRHWR